MGHTASGFMPTAFRLPRRLCSDVNGDVSHDCPTLLARETLRMVND
jgi:hypothetical protein